MADESKQPWEGWAILELMGHRKLGGHVSEQVVAGAAFVRVDVPDTEEGKPAVATQFYAPSAVYCITPTTEELARKLAASCRPTPVQRYELAPASAPETDDHDGSW